MSAKTEGIIRSLRESLKRENEKKTSAYDTRATIRRIEDGVAWVHIPGGVDETPVTLTIGANVGDEVQVRVSGGRAFLVGNATAPPTDDKYARQVNYNLGQQIEQTNVVMRTINRAVQAVKKIADNTNQYFWHTEEGTDTGAHITEIPQEEFLADPENGGGNLLARSNGIAVRDGLTELSVFSGDGTDIYADGYNVAHMGFGTCQNSIGAQVRGMFFSFGPRNAGSSIGEHSFAEGSVTTASGAGAHSEGELTFAEGINSHAEGYWSVASGHRSHAQNMGTVAAYNDQTAIGKYNDNQTDTAFEIGNGTSDINRSNALSVDWNGNILSGNTHKVPCVLPYTFSDQTAAASTRGTLQNLSVPSLPSSATVLGVVVISTPNRHWIWAYAYANSNNTIGINYVNEYNGAISGSFSVLIFYTL